MLRGRKEGRRGTVANLLCEISNFEVFGFSSRWVESEREYTRVMQTKVNKVSSHPTPPPSQPPITYDDWINNKEQIKHTSPRLRIMSDDAPRES